MTGADDRRGYVYVLSNESMPGLLKIGRARDGGAQRSRQLASATGVPTRYRLEFEVLAPDAAALEFSVHERLAACRPNRRREFFACSVAEASFAVLDALSAVLPQHGQEAAPVPAIFDDWVDAIEQFDRALERMRYQPAGPNAFERTVRKFMSRPGDVAQLFVDHFDAGRRSDPPEIRSGGALRGLMSLLSEHDDDFRSAV